MLNQLQTGKRAARFLLLFISTLIISGCSTSKEVMLPPGEQTMLEIWQGTETSPHTAASAREALRRPLTDKNAASQEAQYSRDARSEISQQFPRLPNPDMVMYVFAHLAGNTPVPGYSTVFPFYAQTQYALPGERTEVF